METIQFHRRTYQSTTNTRYFIKKHTNTGTIRNLLKLPLFDRHFILRRLPKGFNRLVDEFNGFKELLIRGDLVETMILTIKRFPEEVLAADYMNEVEKGRYSFQCFVFEIILSQDIVFDKLNLLEEKEYLLAYAKMNDIKKEHSTIFSGFNNVPTYLFYAKKILKDTTFKFESSRQRECIIEFVKSPRVINEELLYVENFMRQKINNY